MDPARPTSGGYRLPAFTNKFLPSYHSIPLDRVVGLAARSTELSKLATEVWKDLCYMRLTFYMSCINETRMQGPSMMVVVVGLLLGFALSYIGLWTQAFMFSKTGCADESSGSNCQTVDFKKALQPTAITIALSLLLVWAAPNMWGAMQGTSDSGN